MRRALVKRLLYVKPTERAISERLGGVGVRLRVYGPVTSRRDRDPSRVAVAVRNRYERHLQQKLRAVSEPVWRAYTAVLRRPFDLATGWARPATPARVRLTIRTLHVTTEQQDLVQSIVAAKLPLGEVRPSWDQRGWRVRVVWRVRLRPPARAGLKELEAAFAALPEHQFYIGPTASGALVVDLDDDAPHLGLSGGSGSGKTVLAMLLAVQTLRRGGEVTILDRKGSHRWALNLPGVTYCLDVADMHHRLIELAATADRRNREALHQRDGWDPGHRHLVLFEELNATLSMLRDYWVEQRGRLKAEAKASGGSAEDVPKASPAVQAAKNILFMGRSAKVNMVAIAQLLTTLAIGGTEARENLGIRALARYTRQAWKMLVGDAKMPRPSRTRGRWIFYVGGEVTEAQVVYLTTKQARAFAIANPARESDSAPTSTVSNDTDNRARITLQEAIDAGLLPWKPAAVHQRMSRSRRAGQWTPPPYGRKGRADTYDRDDLIRWAALEEATR